MTHCLNPVCPQPQNPDNTRFCRTCGLQLLLGDRYRPLNLIGQGGFGRTFLATDEQSNTASRSSSCCVIKQLFWQPSGTMNRQEAIALFQKEVACLKTVGHHPQIPQLLDAFVQEDGQYLVQEFIRGRNLEEVLSAEGPWREAGILKVLTDLLPVLQFIHEQRIIHRDIKPQNIIAPAFDPTDSSSDLSLVLVDFGASKYVPDTPLSRTGTVIGSAGYAAPEQAMGKADYASDLYSLGVTCIHLLTGLHPFDLYSVSEDAWMWRQAMGKPISIALGRILDTLLQKATSKRYATAAIALDDLNQSGLLIGRAMEPIQPRAVPTPSPSPQWQEDRILIGHTGAITAIALSRNGRWLASGSSDRSIKVWELDSGNLIHTFAGRSFWCNSGHAEPICALCFDPDGQTLISGSGDGSIKHWDVRSRSLLTTLAAGWVISALAVGQQSPVLVSGNGDGVINLWDRHTWQEVGQLKKHQDRISALLLSPDGGTLVSASDDRTIRLWNLHSQQVIHTLRGHSDRVSAIAISTDWQTLISAGWDKTLKVWDLSQGRLIWSLVGHAESIHAIALSPNGQWLASGGEANTIKLWHLTAGDRSSNPSQKLRPLLLQHAWGVNALCFTPDGQKLISGSLDETIKIWRQVEDILNIA